MGKWLADYDVVLLQEVYEYWGNQLRQIQASSGHPHSAWFKATYFQRGVYSGIAGLGVLSKHRIVAKVREAFWLDPKDDQAPPQGWPLPYVTITIGGTPVHFFTAHYPHQFENKRGASYLVADLARRIPPNETVIFGADFNGGITSDEVAMIVGTGVLDLWSGTGEDDVDHILARNVRLHRTWRHPVDDGAGKTLTDHWVVGIDVEPRVPTSNPRTRIVSGPPARTTDTTATIHFTADTPGTTFECLYDSERWTPSTSPWVRSGLGVGQRWFGVRGTDPEGNRDPQPAGTTWIIDPPPPPPPPPTHATVPGVVGLVSSQASRAIGAAGLKAWFSGPIRPRSRVVSQSPAAGTKVPRGSTVSCELSDEPLVAPPD